ncbi:MAG: hypothetical protein PHX72_02265, partial [Candidatus Shapirobacteria bacterium]|nr:hypothetical protein [Candidatus Shapirobacteria bacterium]
MLHSIVITGGSLKSRGEVIKKIFKQEKRLRINNDPDTLIIKQEKAIGIDTIRKIKTWLGQKAYQKENRLILIHHAQNLTPEAQNAFLKTLEEPPSNTLIILTTNNIHQLLPTIASRCQIIRLGKKATSKNNLTNKKLIQILNKDLGEKVIFARERGGEKQKFLQWLRKQKQLFRQKPNYEAIKILGLIDQAETMIQANVAPR